MIQYSQRALKGLTYLFRPYNDLDIYVEDELNRNMYEILVERILDGKARVTRVFPLKGRSEVIKACKDDQGSHTRPRLYLIDGDMDIYLSTTDLGLKYLYRLGVYTSENLLMSENAAIEVAYESMPTQDKSSIKKTIGIDDLLEDAAKKLRPLFLMYAVKHYLERKDSKQIHLQTVKYKINHLSIDDQYGITIDKTKITKRISEIRSALINDYGYKKYEIDQAIKAIDSRLPAGDCAFVKYISGKTYLLPLIYHRLKKVARCSCTQEQLKTRLARYCELDIDPELCSSVLAVSQGGNLRN